MHFQYNVVGTHLCSTYVYNLVRCRCTLIVVYPHNLVWGRNVDVSRQVTKPLQWKSNYHITHHIIFSSFLSSQLLYTNVLLIDRPIRYETLCIPQVVVFMYLPLIVTGLTVVVLLILFLVHDTRGWVVGTSKFPCYSYHCCIKLLI